jgi:MFS family permease
MTATQDREQFAERPYGWVVVAVATLCLAAGFGANITVSVFIDPFEQEFGWSRAYISFAYTALTLGAALGGILWGTLSDRIGAKTIAFIGAIAISGALALLSLQRDLWAIYALYFFIGCVGFACLFTPLLALVGLWFDRRKGLALGIVTAGGAIGQGLVPYVTRLLISAADWRDAALYLGVGYLVLLLPAIFLLKPPPVLIDEGEEIRASDDNHWNMPHRISIPWLCAAGLFCCICMAVPIIHLVPLGTDMKLTPETATSLLFVMMVAGTFGRLFFGSLADRIGALYAYFIASAAQTAVVFWFTQTTSLPLLYALSIMFGFGFSGVMTSLIVCAREAAPLRITGFAVASVTTMAWIGMGVGSYQGGYCYDLTGNYTLSYANAAIAGIVHLMIIGGLIWYRNERNRALEAI